MQLRCSPTPLQKNKAKPKRFTAASGGAFNFLRHRFYILKGRNKQLPKLLNIIKAIKHAGQVRPLCYSCLVIIAVTM